MTLPASTLADYIVKAINGGTTADGLETFPEVDPKTFASMHAAIASAHTRFLDHYGIGVVTPTNLAIGTRTGTTVVVTSSTGDDATLPAASATEAGLMTAADKTKLTGIETGAQVNVGTDLAQGTRTATTVPVTSSTGADATLGAATAAVAGVMAAADKSKLDGIEAGAQVNVGTNLLQGTRTATSVPVTSSTGTSATLQAASTSYAGVMTAADKTKLDGIAAGAQVNVPADLSIANRGTDTLDVASSTGTDATLPAATQTQAGLQTSADKTKLDGIAAGAQVNVPADLSIANRGASTLDVASSTGTDATIPAATQTQAGLQTAADKTKLDGIETGAQVNVGTDLSQTLSTTTITVQSSTGADVVLNPPGTNYAGIMTAAAKAKLDGIEAGAQVNVGTDLAATSRTATTLDVTSSTGDAATLPAADSTYAGLMTAADKSKLTGIEAGAQVNVGTDLAQGTRTATQVSITSSTGADAALDAATTALAGLMAAADKLKLDGIEAGAQVNVGTNITQGTRTTTTVPLVSSTGTGTTLVGASASYAGLMVSSDKTKLDGIDHPAMYSDGTTPYLWYKCQEVTPGSSIVNYGTATGGDLTMGANLNPAEPGLFGSCVYNPNSTTGAATGAASVTFGTTSFVLCGWILPRVFTQYGHFFGKKYLNDTSFTTPWAGAMLQFINATATDGIWGFYGSTSAGGSVNHAAANTRLNRGLWNHIGVSYNGSTMYFYWNGFLVDTWSVTGPLGTTAAGHWTVAGLGSYTSEQPNAYFADWRYYRTTKTATFFANAYAAGRPMEF